LIGRGNATWKPAAGALLENLRANVKLTRKASALKRAGKRTFSGPNVSAGAGSSSYVTGCHERHAPAMSQCSHDGVSERRTTGPVD